MKILNPVVKTRTRRLLLSALVPPATGSLVLLLSDLIRVGVFSIEWSMLVLVLLGSYVFMGLQSLVAGLIMEFVVLQYARASYQVIAAGVVLGALAGATLLGMSSALVLTGAGVGLMIGWLNRQCI